MDDIDFYLGKFSSNYYLDCGIIVRGSEGLFLNPILWLRVSFGLSEFTILKVLHSFLLSSHGIGYFDTINKDKFLIPSSDFSHTFIFSYNITHISLKIDNIRMCDISNGINRNPWTSTFPSCCHYDYYFYRDMFLISDRYY